MLVKNKGIGLKTSALIIIVLIVTIFTISPKDLRIARADIVQYLMTMDLGFSYRYSLVADGSKVFHERNQLRIDKYNELRNIFYAKILGVLWLLFL